MTRQDGSLIPVLPSLAVVRRMEVRCDGRCKEVRFLRFAEITCGKQLLRRNSQPEKWLLWMTHGGNVLPSAGDDP